MYYLLWTYKNASSVCTYQANILVDEGGTPILADFGISKTIHDQTSNELKGCCSIRWAAPEVLNRGSKSFESDIFSLAMVISEVCILLFASTIIWLYRLPLSDPQRQDTVRHMPKSRKPCYTINSARSSPTETTRTVTKWREFSVVLGDCRIRLASGPSLTSTCSESANKA
jgi:serine/threonine protein kinase